MGTRLKQSIIATQLIKDAKAVASRIYENSDRAEIRQAEFLEGVKWAIDQMKAPKGKSTKNAQDDHANTI